MKRILTVGHLRFLYLIAVENLGGEALRDVRIRDTVDTLSALCEEVQQLAV